MELIEKNSKKISPDFSSEKVKINLEHANSLLGLKLTEKEAKKYLEEMGHNYNKGIVEIAPWRTDILHEVDLIEDIAIAYGYENFIPEIPNLNTTGGEDRKETIKRKIGDILCGLDFLETSNYHLTSKNDQFKKMILPEENFVEIKESKTEYTILRKDLTHYLLKILSENVDAEYPQRIFEIGKIFNGMKGRGETGSDLAETESLALAITPSNFTEVRQVLEYLSKMLNLKLEISEPSKCPNYLVEGRTIEIKFENKIIGYLGEVHPKILKNWRIKMPVSIFEINLEEIFKKLQ